ncbi:MAG TPA: hypothetical protein VK563_04335 [Puia sp.]|nr:hypothetical protein [Puia sp.]
MSLLPGQDLLKTPGGIAQLDIPKTYASMPTISSWMARWTTTRDWRARWIISEWCCRIAAS